ncbi:MAG: NCS2 family permease [Limnochordaceae bacterium]|nr:NCS2 family permease [Limnochordaceae bacterium]
MNLQDWLAVFGVVLNGIPQGLLALGYGFAALPTALAFAIGLVGTWAFHSVAPISFQAETITLVGTLGSNMRERLSILFWEGVIMTFVGAFGLLEEIVNLIGPQVTSAMMAGVGIMLAYVAIQMGLSSPWVAAASAAVALSVWAFTGNLVHTIVWSVLAGTIVGRFVSFQATESSPERERFRLQPLVWRFWESPTVLRGALSLSMLNIGANITFGKITGQIARANVNVDHLAVYSSLADVSSSLFGGAPVEAIISATGAAPHPHFAAMAMMAVFVVILLLGLLPRIGRYVPQASIAGFLFVLGAIVTLPTNVQLAFQDVALNSPMAAILGVTIVVSARFDPFLGMVAGTLLRAVFALAGAI